MTEQEKIIRDYVEAYNRFDVAGMLINLDEAIRFVNISNGVVTMTLDGIAAFKEAAEKAKGLFSKRTQTITSTFFDNDIVTVAINYHAILATDLSVELKQGDELNLTGKSVFKFRNNKIIELMDMS